MARARTDSASSGSGYTTSMSGWVPGCHNIPAPLFLEPGFPNGPTGWLGSRTTRHAVCWELQGCPRAWEARSLSPYQPIAKSASGRTASHLFLLGPSMLPPLILPNLSRFLKQFQLNGFSISLIKSAPARSAAHPCKQEFPAGQLLSEKKKKVWIFSWKMISSKQNYVAS